MEGDFFTILFGLVAGFLLARFVIQFFLELPSLDEDGDGTISAIRQTNECKLHDWKPNSNNRLQCTVCKRIPT